MHDKELKNLNEDIVAAREKSEENSVVGCWRLETDFTLDLKKSRKCDRDVLGAVLRLRGDAKKRKKKTYTEPKKTYTKPKKIKLAILQFYKVDDPGKVHRLRKESPNGTFMANHFDRH
ncbi:hypothetical protein Fmac_031500 [Flemingia macrophylla]|uniref:Small ribosomal subunit protein eS31 domain-containing protein n=1 Tax=Flemingia macrophylla TaxID=520843 RepID=A0ABD1L285_9FABA